MSSGCCVSNLPKALKRSGKMPAARPLYVVAEKILGPSESLVESWAVSRNDGYEFLNEVNGLFVDGRGRAALDRLYRDLVEDDRSFSDVVYQSKNCSSFKSRSRASCTC